MTAVFPKKDSGLMGMASLLLSGHLVYPHYAHRGCRDEFPSPNFFPL